MLNYLASLGVLELTPIGLEELVRMPPQDGMPDCLLLVLQGCGLVDPNHIKEFVPRSVFPLKLGNPRHVLESHFGSIPYSILKVIPTNVMKGEEHVIVFSISLRSNLFLASEFLLALPLECSPLVFGQASRSRPFNTTATPGGWFRVASATSFFMHARSTSSMFGGWARASRRGVLSLGWK